MIATFRDMENKANELNGTAIHDGDRLRQILYGMQDKEPFVCELVGDNGFYLAIGVGPVGFVEYSRYDGSPPHLMAVSPVNAVEDNDKEFLAGGTPTPVEARFCMPFDDVVKIAVYFLENSAACPFFSWEEI